MNPNEKISHIEPKKKWLDVDIKGLWRYRDLYQMYIKRDIVTQYKQTILGPLWYVIQPLLTTIMYMFVFGGLAGISTDGIPQPLFYMAGITLWNYFNTCFSSCSEDFSHNANVFGKVLYEQPDTYVDTIDNVHHYLCILCRYWQIFSQPFHLDSLFPSIHSYDRVTCIVMGSSLLIMDY